MPAWVINLVNKQAEHEGMPMGLKIESRRTGVLYDLDDEEEDDDPALTAGVEDEEPESENQENQEDENQENQEDEDNQIETDEVDPNDLAKVLEDPVQADSSQEESHPQQDENQTDGDQEVIYIDESKESQTPEGEDAENTMNEEQEPRRSTRVRFQSKPAYEPTFRGKSYAQAADPNSMEYDSQEAKVLAMIMMQIKERAVRSVVAYGKQLLVTYSLKKGLEKFGDRGKEATLKEMKQMHDRDCFDPIHKQELNDIKRSRTLESLIFLAEKKSGTIKARHCANGSTQRDYMTREDTSSPTVSTEAVMLTAVIEAEEQRDIATCDIPNAFIQTELNPDEEGNRTIMKIRGPLVDILCEMDPKYKEYVTFEGNSKVLYVHVTKAIYGLLVSAMLFYKKLMADLRGIGFEVNPYDPCVANKTVDGNQLTVCWHVDDLKSSHVRAEVNTSFLEWVKKQYGAIGEVKMTRGKVHEYLGMKLDYTKKNQVTIDMVKYVKSMLQVFPEEHLSGAKVSSPWNENLFKVNDKSPSLPSDLKEQFHTTTAQGLFLCKQA